MKQRTVKHNIDGLAALLLFGIFAACVLSVLLSGAGAYRRLTQRDLTAYDRRTGLQYIAARVRQADRQGAVTVEDFGGASALRLEDAEGYSTWVYYYDGYIAELYSSGDDGLALADGDPVIAVQSLDFSLEDGLLTVNMEDAQGQADVLLLSLRGGEEAGA